MYACFLCGVCFAPHEHHPELGVFVSGWWGKGKVQKEPTSLAHRWPRFTGGNYFVFPFPFWSRLNAWLRVRVFLVSKLFLGFFFWGWF
jgi:hypothetical protein